MPGNNKTYLPKALEPLHEADLALRSKFLNYKVLVKFVHKVTDIMTNIVKCILFLLFLKFYKARF